MILDSSALVAVVMAEPGYQVLLDKIRAAPAKGIGTPTLLETLLVLSSRLHGDASPVLLMLLEELEVERISFTEEHAAAALSAFLKFGKGRHRAALNFGDCAAYAVARISGEPLLFTGQDFSRTDISAA